MSAAGHEYAVPCIRAEASADPAPIYNDLKASAERHDSTSASQAFMRSFERDPHSAECQFHLGMLLSQSRHHDAAVLAFLRAVDLRPDWAMAHHSLGAELKALGRMREAEEAFRLVTRLAPALPDGYCDLASLLSGLNRPRDAVTVLQQAAGFCPPSARIHYDTGHLLRILGEHFDAELQFIRALEIDPAYPMAALQLADLLRMSDRLEQAEAYARGVVESHPLLPWAHFTLGNVLMAKGTGEQHEALGHFRQTVELAPNSLAAHQNLAFSLMFAEEDAYAVLAECRRLAMKFEQPFLGTAIPYPNDATPSRRLRIGYVSPDFRDHCVAMFMTPLLKHHNRESVEIYGYASVAKPDAHTARLASLVDVWRDVAWCNDTELALQILEDRIDILVDLSMYMANGRPLVFARRPAPVQVAWLAYPGTTGSQSLGYRITDPWLDPIDDGGTDDRYSERSIRLPDTFWCYDPLSTGPEPGSLPAERAGHVTFGCLNSPQKLTRRTFELWARVLNHVPHSRLLLQLPSGRSRDIVRAAFAERGIDGGRLSFVSYQPREQYLRTYQQIDIALDVFPYNGHTTSLDALWMGVPVVTIIGNTPQSRAGYALLSNIGLGEWAASSDDAFVLNAVALASDLCRLGDLRQGLRSRMERSPLMDGARFARNMEAAYRQMWNEWCVTRNGHS